MPLWPGDAPGRAKACTTSELLARSRKATIRETAQQKKGPPSGFSPALAGLPLSGTHALPHGATAKRTTIAPIIIRTPHLSTAFDAFRGTP